MRIIIIIYSILFYSCQYTSKYKDAHSFNYNDIPMAKVLNGKTVNLEDSVIMPVQLSVVNAELLLLNIRTEMFIHKFNLSSMRKTGESVPFGRGPNEMLEARKIQVVDSSIWLYDKMARKIHKYNMNDFCYSDDPEVKRTVHYKEFLDDISILSDNIFVVTKLPLSDENYNRLFFFDMDGNLISQKGYLPDDGVKKTFFEYGQATLCNLAVNLLEKKICLTYKLTDLIEIYDFEGNLLKRIHGPEKFFAQIRQNNENNGEITIAPLKGKTRDAYFCPVNYNNEIWTLYSGQYWGDSNNNELLSTIIVFDWEGNPLRHYKLDPSVFTFTFDEQNKKIYAITNDPEFHIVKFDL